MIYNTAEMTLLQCVTEHGTPDDLVQLQRLFKTRRYLSTRHDEREKELSKLRDDLTVVQNDRDLYRRRCQLAYTLLDECCTVDLEAVADALYGKLPPLAPPSTVPVSDDPTQVPTLVDDPVTL